MSGLLVPEDTSPSWQQVAGAMVEAFSTITKCKREVGGGGLNRNGLHRLKDLDA